MANGTVCAARECPRTIVPPALFCPHHWSRLPVHARRALANAYSRNRWLEDAWCSAASEAVHILYQQEHGEPA